MVEDQAGRQCVRLTWESLLQVDAKDGRLLPGLAREWSVSDDGLLVIFDLDEAAAWQDGVPLTAADVVATIQYLTMPGSRSPWQIDLLAIEEVVASGEHQVRITLSEAGCSALYDIGLAPILPAHQLSGLTADDPATSLVGSGPFQPGEPSDDGSWVLIKNANYHTPVSLDELIVIPFESSDDLYRAWESGQVDVAHLPAGYDGLVEKEHSVSFAAGDYMLLVFNMRRGVLMDASVREALTLALDRESIAEQVSPAGATLLAASLHPDHWALSEADLPASSYDPMAAGDLLSEAGWADEDGDGWRNKWDTILSLDVITNGENPLRMSMASLVAQSYRLIGIESELHAIEWSIFLDLLFRHEFDVAVISWPFPLDPDQRMFWHSSETIAGRGFNVGQWVSDEADRLLDEAAVFPACDVPGRTALYGEFARLMGQEYPVVPLFVAHDRLLAREGVRGSRPKCVCRPILERAGVERIRLSRDERSTVSPRHCRKCLAPAGRMFSGGPKPHLRTFTLGDAPILREPLR